MGNRNNMGNNNNNNVSLASLSFPADLLDLFGEKIIGLYQNRVNVIHLFSRHSSTKPRIQSSSAVDKCSPIATTTTTVKAATTGCPQTTPLTTTTIITTTTIRAISRQIFPWNSCAKNRKSSRQISLLNLWVRSSIEVEQEEEEEVEERDGMDRQEVEEEEVRRGEEEEEEGVSAAVVVME